MLANENDTVILTLIGIGGYDLAADLSGVLDGAAELLPPDISSVLASATPIGQLHHRQYPASVWRRYDKLGSFPDGFLVIGDAVCSFNPVYGQGMTSAARQALALRKAINNTSSRELSLTFFRSVSRQVSPIWRANRLNDFAVSSTDGWAARAQRVFNAYTTAYMAAAADDAALTESFLRVLQGIESGMSLATPRRAARVLATSVSRR